MFGGLLARCASLGTPVHVLAVTGGAAGPDSIDSRPSARLRSIAQGDALEELGLTAATVTQLGITDGTVTDHEDELVDAITALVEDRSIGSVLTPWENDHHTDHEACGRAVRRARSDGISDCSVVSGVFWSMLREPAPPDLTLAALVLTSEEMMRKSAAIRRHRRNFASVVCDAPVLGENDLAPTRWRREHLIVEPAA